MSTRELVEAAARLLDDKMPGWAQNVDLDTLNMLALSLCILGSQPSEGRGRCAPGNFVVAADTLGLGPGMTHPLANAFGYGEGEDGVDLEGCWRTEVALRQAAHAGRVADKLALDAEEVPVGSL